MSTTILQFTWQDIVAGLSRPWLNLERLHLRFTLPTARYGFRSSAALVPAQQGACPRTAGGLSPPQQGACPRHSRGACPRHSRGLVPATAGGFPPQQGACPRTAGGLSPPQQGACPRTAGGLSPHSRGTSRPISSPSSGILSAICRQAPGFI
jgi:hypothetical protein